MKYPTASSAQGGGGVNVKRQAVPSGGGAAKGTMGTGTVTKPNANGITGTGSPVACKHTGAMGKG